jgi:hypothetical protein
VIGILVRTPHRPAFGGIVQRVRGRGGCLRWQMNSPRGFIAVDEALVRGFDRLIASEAQDP